MPGGFHFNAKFWELEVVRNFVRFGRQQQHLLSKLRITFVFKIRDELNLKLIPSWQVDRRTDLLTALLLILIACLSDTYPHGSGAEGVREDELLMENLQDILAIGRYTSDKN